MCDFGTGNNNKLNWVLEDKQELIDIIETIYRGAKKGRGLVVSPKGTFSFLTLWDILYQNRELLLVWQADCVLCRLLDKISLLRRRGIREHYERKLTFLQLARKGLIVSISFLL